MAGLPATGTLLSIQLCISLLDSFFQGLFPYQHTFDVPLPTKKTDLAVCVDLFSLEFLNASSSVPCSSCGTLLPVFKHEPLFPPFAYVVPSSKHIHTQAPCEDPTGSPLELPEVSILFSDSA